MRHMPLRTRQLAIIGHIRQAEFRNSMARSPTTHCQMNGIGNEIVVVDLRDSKSAVTPEDRGRGASPAGVPYDRLMVLQPPRLQATEAFIRI